MRSGARGHAWSGRGRRAGAAVVLAALGVAGLAACGDSPEPDVATVSVEDLHDLEDAVAGLEERVAALEGVPLGSAATPSPSAVPREVGDDRDAAFLSDPGSSLGEKVTVTATVTGVATVTDIGAAFRLGDGVGYSVPVVSATPVDAVDATGAVEVSGTVLRVRQDTFESDFGIAADELFEAPDRWFTTNEGDVAISADSVTLVQEERDR